MSEEEEIIVQPPAPPKKTLLGMPRTDDAHQWARKWSTWLGIVAAGCVGSLGAYTMAPARAQATVPEWALAVLIGLGMICGFGIGVATSVQQGLKK